MMYLHTVNMMYQLVALLCLFYTSQAIPAPGHGLLAGYCKTSSDCAADECCVSFNQPRGKRTAVPSLSALNPSLMALVDGSCHKRGNQSSRCIVAGGTSPVPDGLFYDCPCLRGFVCKGTGQIVLNKGEAGVCTDATIRTATTLNQPCVSGADCADSECCVSDIRPIGKRSKKRSTHGHCQAMRGSGDGCLVRYKPGKPKDVVFQCPCSAGLTCHGIGIHDIPLGELGKCM